MGLSDLANASYEKRQQRIMRLRMLFNQQKIVTVESCMQQLGYQQNTVVKWCKDGDIPLLLAGVPVVPVTAKNKPRWLK